MSYNPNVVYSVIDESGREEKFSYICFSGIKSLNKNVVPKLKEIVYFCPLDASLSKETAEKYLNKVLGYFPDCSYDFFLDKDGINKYKFTVPIGQKDNYLLLMILSFFRYVNEFPELVKYSIETEGDFWDNFVKSHFLNLNKKYDKLWVHGVITTYGDPKTTVSESVFLDRIKNKTYSSVNDYFKI